MKDKGLAKGLVSDFDSSGVKSGNFFGFRKMFRDYLNKLSVPFFDSCCPDASTVGSPVRFNEETGELEFFNGTEWIDTGVVLPTTTTTTTAAPTTTTTTTVAPTTTTTTTV